MLVAYQRGVAADDQRLYVFDPDFVDKIPNLAALYAPLSHLGRDLFDLLASRYPKFRWLVTGHPRSGSSFHINPNATSAWNAVIRGRKTLVIIPTRPTTTRCTSLTLRVLMFQHT